MNNKQYVTREERRVASKRDAPKVCVQFSADQYTLCTEKLVHRPGSQSTNLSLVVTNFPFSLRGQFVLFVDLTFLHDCVWGIVINRTFRKSPLVANAGTENLPPDWTLLTFHS